MKALTLTSLALALVLASPGEAKDIIDISAGNSSVDPAPQPDLAHLKRGDSSGDVSHSPEGPQRPWRALDGRRHLWAANREGGEGLPSAERPGVERRSGTQALGVLSAAPHPGLRPLSKTQGRQRRRLRSTRGRSRALTQNSRKQRLNVMSFKPNWIRPRRRPKQPNPSSRTSSLI